MKSLASLLFHYTLYACISVITAAVPGSASANEIINPPKRFLRDTGGTLYPQDTETRDLRTLDGIWNFRKSPTDPEYGYRHGWFQTDLDKVTCAEVFRSLRSPEEYLAAVWCVAVFVIDCWIQLTEDLLQVFRPSVLFYEMHDKDPCFLEKWFFRDLRQTGPVIPMPVPASYNDIGQDASLRDHVGLVWYDRRFHVPPWWKRAEQRVWLRFSSVHYAAKVWVNGKEVTYHEIGHLPFEVEITSDVRTNSSNLLTVAVDNTLLRDTVPQGVILTRNYGHKKVTLEQTYTFDFFNYAGIHRTVFLYTTPQLYIDDVIVNTDIQGHTGFIVYNITFKGAANNEEVECLVQLFDKNNTQVVGSNDCAGLLEIANANFWWPYLMNADPGYLYTMKTSLIGSHGEVIDTYSQKVGIRTVTWTNKTVYINEKPIYFKGFGMHEDSDLRGKGWDPVLWVKNFNLLRWVGANAFRTSHYPYAEEIYQMADEQGIMIIDECPSVDTDIFSDSLLAKHKQSLTELIRRDKNHPSVIMWSIANEPRTQNAPADAYFEKVVMHVKTMDLSRPVTIALAQPSQVDVAGKHLDVISFNRYNAWYHDTGFLDRIFGNVVSEAQEWHRKYNKPVLMSEYGADTMAGLHLMPEYVWSEEYQVSLFAEHFRAFDKLRKTGFFIGEFIWNFADFKTSQKYIRVGGNLKGIFTRQRQPKAAAFLVRQRYFELAVADHAAEIPDDLSHYASDHLPAIHDEL